MYAKNEKEIVCNSIELKNYKKKRKEKRCHLFSYLLNNKK